MRCVRCCAVWCDVAVAALTASLQVPTATLRAGFQPKYRQVLLPFEPQDASTYLSTTKRSFTKQESDEYRKHIAPELEREHHMRCGEFSNYLTEAILKKVEYYKVGH